MPREAEDDDREPGDLYSIVSLAQVGIDRLLACVRAHIQPSGMADDELESYLYRHLRIDRE